MFVLRIQSVDFPAFADEVGTSGGGAAATTSHPLSPRSSHPPPSTTPSSTNPLELPGATSAAHARNPSIHHTRGVLHLYRLSPTTSSSSYASAVVATSSSSSSGPTAPQPASDSLLPPWRGTRLLVLAVPTHVSPDDFVRFCGPYVERATDIRFIRDDGVEDRYSVLVEFEDQKSADGFYLDLNGWRFSSLEGEVCHVLFIFSVQYTPSTEIATTPPIGSTELPTCPVCIERLDQDISGILATTCDHSFQCSCVSVWVNSSCPVCQFCQKQSENSTCSVCQTTGNLWICVICGFVGCGRYKEGHAKQHWKDTQHCYSLDLETQRVWDYVGDSYVHRLNQSKSDAKHAKFKSKCKYSGDDCVNCSCNDDSDMGGAMFSSKAETIVDEYNRLLASQLETQREYYEALLSEAKREREQHVSEAVDKAVNDKLQEIQLKLENLIVEKKKVADMNEKLTRNQDVWRETLKDIEEREKAQLMSKDETIRDLEEQIKDFKFSIKLQKSIEKSTHADGLKGGTLVPLPMVSDSEGKGKRSSRTSKRRN
ncbi:BRAP2 RING ZnF UBP domain-containing protein 1-like isoform X1 [Phragmites australis]|uniref:BRAP2 RING ZnF UBP domain-containing protein 1-like isoform X1 n=1 Tax=Phragmites australis TaxID=29695 RepID=UPI002D767826|nr:BRAP2 RING ZnF UBP domain-containing protein 1-like isoform X1 [Phragmites australis]